MYGLSADPPSQDGGGGSLKPSEQLQQLQQLFVARQQQQQQQQQLLQQQQQQQPPTHDGSMQQPQHDSLMISPPGQQPQHPLVNSVGNNDLLCNSSSYQQQTQQAQYSRGARLLIYVDSPTGAYCLVENDVRNFLSVFCTVEQVRILADRAAVEVYIHPASAAGSVVSELDHVPLPGYGVLRAQTLNSSMSPEAALPCTSSDPGGPSGGGDRSYRRGGGGGGSSSSSRSSGLRKVCRLELIDLFSYEPDFAVTKVILGEKNSNIAYIMEQANHKVDISIKGKPVNDVPVAERLHIAIGSEDSDAYDKAVMMAEDLLQSVCEQFVQFCESRSLLTPMNCGFRRHIYEQKPDKSLIYMGAKVRPRTWLLRSQGIPVLPQGGGAIPPPLPIPLGALPIPPLPPPVLGPLPPPFLPPGVSPFHQGLGAGTGGSGASGGAHTNNGAAGGTGASGGGSSSSSGIRDRSRSRGGGDRDRDRDERSRERRHGSRDRDRDYYRGSSPRRGGGGRPPRGRGGKEGRRQQKS